jgi:hypothetical protein
MKPFDGEGVFWLPSDDERYSKPHVIEKKKRPRVASNASS